MIDPCILLNLNGGIDLAKELSEEGLKEYAHRGKTEEYHMGDHYVLCGGDIACSLSELDGGVRTRNLLKNSCYVGVIGVEHTAEHNEHNEDHKDIGLLTLGESVEKTKERQQGEEHRGEAAKAHSLSLKLSCGIGDLGEIQGIHQKSNKKHSEGYVLRIALKGHEALALQLSEGGFNLFTIDLHLSFLLY